MNEGWIKAVLIQEGNLPTVADCCRIAALLANASAERSLAIARAAYEAGYADGRASTEDKVYNNDLRDIIREVDEGGDYRTQSGDSERRSTSEAAVSAPESALQAPDQSGVRPQDAALGEHRLHAGKEAEPPQARDLDDACNPAWEWGYLRGRADERARAVELIKALLDLATCDEEERLLLNDALVRADIEAARAYCEEKP